MIAKIQVYDDSVMELVKRLDEIARKDDPGKYGLRLNNSEFSSAVYHWLYTKDKELSESNEQGD